MHKTRAILRQKYGRLLGATFLNYLTYTSWTLLNKYQFLPLDRALDADSSSSSSSSHQRSHGYGVTCPLFVTGIQMVLAGVFAAIAIFVFGVQKRSREEQQRLFTMKTMQHRILPLGIARCVDIGAGNTALVSISVAVQQVIKSLLPLFVSLLTITVLGKPVGQLIWLSLIPIVVGTVMATVGSASLTFMGVGLALISCFARSFKCVLNAKLLHVSEEPLLPLEILLLEAPSSGVLLLLSSALIFEGSKVAANSAELWGAVPNNILGGLLMFFNQASYITIIDASSAVTCQVLMNIKMLFVILISVHLFHTNLS